MVVQNPGIKRHCPVFKSNDGEASAGEGKYVRLGETLSMGRQQGNGGMVGHEDV